MYKLPIIAAAALGLMMTAASAQTTPSAPHAAGGAPASTAPAKRPQPDPLAQQDVSKIDGSAVFDQNNKNIGHVSTVLMDPQSKKIDKLVVSSGGVLGIGGREVAIPLDQFAWDSSQDGFKLKMTETALKNQPEWKEGGQTATGSSAPPANNNPPANAGK